METKTKLNFIIILVSIALFLTAVNIKFSASNSNNNVKDENITVITDAEPCSHDWTVLDENDDYYSALVNCKKCGELVIIDYRNHRMKIKE